MILSVAAATSRLDDAAAAPSPTTSSTASPTMSYTVSSYPAFSRLRAMGLPMMPKPTKPIFRPSYGLLTINCRHFL